MTKAELSGQDGHYCIHTDKTEIHLGVANKAICITPYTDNK